MTIAGVTFLRSSGLPSRPTVIRIISPTEADGYLLRWPLQLVTPIIFNDLAPVLSAQFITAVTGRPRETLSLQPRPYPVLPLFADITPKEKIRKLFKVYNYLDTSDIFNDIF